MTKTAPPPATVPKLTCPECRHENEPERIYCHDCGARLDRSRLGKVKQAAEDPRETRKRLQRMLSGDGLKTRRLFFTTCKMILGACALAAVVEMILPADLPPRSKEVTLAPSISMDLTTAAMERRPAELRYTEEQVNAAIASALRTKQAALSNFAFHFERALVTFEEGRCRITIERSAFGWPVYTSGTYAVVVKNGALTLQNLGGAIGRLPVDRLVMQRAGFLFADFVHAFDREQKALAKMSAVEFHPKLVVVRAAQPGAAAQ